MLRAVDIRTIAAREGIDAGIVEKDYVLTKTLSQLSQDSSSTKDLVFKGGTALRKCYFADWRFSEDLDFTSTVLLDPSAIRVMFSRIAKAVTDTFGVEMRVIEYSHYPRKGDAIVSAQLKLGYAGPLQKSSGQKNNIKVDLSFDEQIIEEPRSMKVISTYPDDSLSTLVVYSLNEILAEKMRSILQRGKSRDFYDVWCLIGTHPTDFDWASVWTIFLKKLQVKGIVTPHVVDDLLPEARVSAAKQFWKRGIAHQVRKLPDFDEVQSELRAALSLAFGKFLR